MLTLSSKNFKGVFQQNGSEWRIANSEWFSGGQCSRTAENFSAHQEMHPPAKTAASGE